MTGAIVLALAGLVLLAAGSDQLVKGAARLAMMLGRSPVIVGTVVIGLGTSSPEIFISAVSAAQGSLDIAVGNVIGSNTANLSLVLGIAALIATVPATEAKLRREVPLSAASVVLFALLVQDGLTRREGIIMIAALAAALTWLIFHSRESEPALTPMRHLEGRERGSLAREIVRTLAGLAATVGGAQLLVGGAQTVATEVGISEGIIAVTLVAIGTSLPELVTSIQGARHGETQLIAGTLVGSSMFNSLAVAGIAALIGPGALDDPSLAGGATWLMVAVTVLAYVTMITRHRVGRREGALLVAVYLVGMTLTTLL